MQNFLWLYPTEDDGNREQDDVEEGVLIERPIVDGSASERASDCFATTTL